MDDPNGVFEFRSLQYALDALREHQNRLQALQYALDAVREHQNRLQEQEDEAPPFILAPVDNNALLRRRRARQRAEAAERLNAQHPQRMVENNHHIDGLVPPQKSRTTEGPTS